MNADTAEAIITETEALLSALGENGELILKPGDDATAAITGLVELIQESQARTDLYRRTVLGILSATGGK